MILSIPKVSVKLLWVVLTHKKLFTVTRGPRLRSRAQGGHPRVIQTKCFPIGKVSSNSAKPHFWVTCLEVDGVSYLEKGCCNQMPEGGECCPLSSYSLLTPFQHKPSVSMFDIIWCSTGLSEEWLGNLGAYVDSPANGFSGLTLPQFIWWFWLEFGTTGVFSINMALCTISRYTVF